MAADLTLIQKHLSFLSSDLQKEFSRDGVIMDFTEGTEILREGQSVKMIPVVLEGLIKVFTRNEDKELLLYYIEPKESCVMSFLAGIKSNPSKIFAITEKPTQALLLPSQKVEIWIHQYPSLNTLFYDLYNTRYSELIDTLNQLIFQKMDGRLLDYLKEKARVKSTHLLVLRHREIAQELGTSREVITRVLKKLEKEGKIRQRESGIELI